MEQITDDSFTKIKWAEPGKTYLCFLDVDVTHNDTSFLLNRIDPLRNICELTNYIDKSNSIKEYCDTLDSQRKKEIDKEIERVKAEMEDSAKQRDEQY